MGQGVIPCHDEGAEEGLVGLGKDEEEEEGGKDQTPLPVDGSLEKHLVVDVGDVKGGEEGGDAEAHGQGKRLVVPVRMEYGGFE